MSLLPLPPEEETGPAAPSAYGGTPPPRRSPQELDERNRLYGHAGVARAEEILLGRYGLGAGQEAFLLLRNTSQRFNIKLHTLADAVVRTPAPDSGTALWFPGRVRYSPPLLPGLVLDRDGHGSQGSLLKAVLNRVLALTQTPMGNVQLAGGGRLRLTRHTGLNKYFTDFFAFVDAPTTSCSQAAAEHRQVTVTEVATAAVFDEASRYAILQTGSRACHSVPLTDSRGAVLGMVSSHHERPLRGFTRAQLTALQRTGADAGRWLSWHWHTVVLDALEHLHATASAAAQRA